MTQPGRKYQATSTSNYRYSINGQEKEKELNENITTAEYWEFDSRIGRRWNVDPLPDVSISPYATFGNNPILNSDPDGDTLTNPQLRDAAKIASTEIKSRIDKEEGFGLASKNYLKPLNTAITNYVESNKIKGQDRVDFYNNVQAYYSGYADVAMMSGSDFMQLNRLINNPGVGDARALRLTQASIQYNHAQLLSILTISANVALGEAAAALGAPVGRGPRAPSTTPSRSVPGNTVPENIHPGQQGKHIIGHNNYTPGRSILTENPNNLLKQFHANETTILRQPNANKIIVDFHRPIGIYVNPKLKTSAITTRGAINFGKSGAHIVPTAPQ